jgi:formylglycine-generating enzyme required for sulfatase activity
MAEFGVAPAAHTQRPLHEPSPDRGMIFIPGGTFRMGSDRHYPEEAPVHRVTVGGFWIDRTPVANRDFRKFVNATGHVTFAEIAPDPKDYPGALPRMLKAGSLVFAPPKHAVDLRNWGEWWAFKFGANWRRPYGPRSSISGLFLHENLALDGYERTSPVTAFQPNGYGLHDMIGNVWRRSVRERGRGELLPFYKFWFLTRHFRPSTGVELAAIVVPGDNLRRSC